MLVQFGIGLSIFQLKYKLSYAMLIFIFQERERVRERDTKKKWRQGTLQVSPAETWLTVYRRCPVLEQAHLPSRVQPRFEYFFQNFENSARSSDLASQTDNFSKVSDSSTLFS